VEAPSRQDDGDGGPALAAILAASLILKLALLVPAHDTYPVGDARDYLRAAHQFRDGSYTSIRPPLWPATLSAAIAISAWWNPQSVTPIGETLPGQRRPPRPAPSDLDLARLLCVLFSSITVWLMFLLGKELFDARAGLVAAGCAAFYPNFVGYTHLLWADSQLLMLNAGWLWLLLRGARSNSLPLLAAAGITLGLAALTRQLVASFAWIGAAWLLWNGLAAPRRKLAMAATFLLAVAIPIAPWMARNTADLGRLVPIAPAGGWALLHGVTDDVPGEVARAGIPAALRRVPPVTPLETNELALNHALAIIRADPAGYLQRVVVVNVPDLWRLGSRVIEYLRWGGGSGPQRQHGYRGVPGWLGRAAIGVFVAAYLAALIGGILGVAAAPRWRETCLFAAFVVHGIAMHAIVGANLRHRIYLMPVMLLYAGFAFSRHAVDWRQLLTRRRAVVAAGLLGFFALMLAADDHPEMREQWRFFASVTDPPPPPVAGSSP
jgi:4-amino-4-deoxy-L-arabinose transferase-like glycosyltransferase